MHNDDPTVPSKPGRMTPAEKADHERSVHDYPDIDFSPTEYMVIDVQRSIWGLVRAWLIALAIFGVIVVLVLLIDSTTMVALTDAQKVCMIALAAVIPVFVGALGTHVFNQNTFRVTNERIIAHLQYTPFAYRSQNIEIEHIEDCSYSQTGILQNMLNYGTIRLSTVGNEQTYSYTFVADPKAQFGPINRVIQQVDEGQPPKEP